MPYRMGKEGVMHVTTIEDRGTSFAIHVIGGEYGPHWADLPKENVDGSVRVNTTGQSQELREAIRNYEETHTRTKMVTEATPNTEGTTTGAQTKTPLEETGDYIREVINAHVKSEEDRYKDKIAQAENVLTHANQDLSEILDEAISHLREKYTELDKGYEEGNKQKVEIGNQQNQIGAQMAVISDLISDYKDRQNALES